MKGSAWSAVRHSEGYVAPVQVFEVGAMDSSCEAVKVEREKIWRFGNTARTWGNIARAAARDVKVVRRRIAAKST